MPHMPLKPDSPPAGITLRDDVTNDDVRAVRRIVEATQFFRPDEVDVAVELVEERIARGPQSGYEFLLAEQQGVLVGYACFGPIACTLGSFDLYWIAVDPAHQARGVGRWLLFQSEQQIRNCGGRHVYIETSGRPQYAPTRTFYAACGYHVVATLADFYDVDDDKVVWRKCLQRR